MKKKVIFLIHQLFIYSILSCSTYNYHKSLEKNFIVPDNLSKIPVTKKPIIIIFTNRKKSAKDNDYKYFSNTIDQKKRISQIVIYESNNKWIMFYFKNFVQALKKLLLTRDILVFIHGDGKVFADTVERCIKLKNLYNVNVIAFDWPSENPEKGISANFFQSLENAENSIGHFAKFINELKTFIKKQNGNIKSVNILFHSMGAYILQKYIEKGLNPKKSIPIFDNLILNASAVKQKNHAKWLERVKIQRNIYVTSNTNDFTLNGASILLLSSMLGVTTDKPLALNAHYIDFSNVSNFDHNYFLNDSPKKNKNVKYFYNEVLHGKTIDLNKEDIFYKRNNIRIYKVLK